MCDLIRKFESKSFENVLIVDSHMHLGKPYQFFTSRHDVESLIHSMNLNSINNGCISSFDSIGQDVVYGNMQIEELTERYPDRFIGQFGVNPNYHNELEVILEDMSGKKCFRQIKIHPDFHKYPIHGKQYQKVYKFSSEYKYSILVHTWGVSDVKRLGEIAHAYPEVDFIIGHSGGTIEAIKESVSISQKKENIYLDLTLSYNYQGIIEWMVEEVEVSRLLFGSDATHNSQSAALGRIIYANIRDEEKLKILGLNMINLLNKQSNKID